MGGEDCSVLNVSRSERSEENGSVLLVMEGSRSVPVCVLLPEYAGKCPPCGTSKCTSSDDIDIPPLNKQTVFEYFESMC